MEKQLTERIISYIPSIDEPLSADVVIVRGDKATYIYDVGNNAEVTKYLNSLPGPKHVILSHFHKDHTGKINETDYASLYVGNQTYKSLGIGTVVTEPITIEDGVKIDIIPCPSCHAKGCLVLMIADMYIATGDTTYAVYKNDAIVYNDSLLNEEILKLESLPATKYFLSHRDGRFLSKELILRQLKGVYAKRKPSEAYIEIK